MAAYHRLRGRLERAQQTLNELLRCPQTTRTHARIRVVVQEIAAAIEDCKQWREGHYRSYESPRYDD